MPAFLLLSSQNILKSYSRQYLEHTPKTFSEVMSWLNMSQKVYRDAKIINYNRHLDKTEDAMQKNECICGL